MEQRLEAKRGHLIRLAQADDIPLLWEWANDPTTRAHAFNQEPIPSGTHVQWCHTRLASPDTRIWLMEVDGEPVGQIRYDRAADAQSAEVSLSVARRHRGNGYGLELVQRTQRRAADELGVPEIVALVLTGNVASYRTFARAGYAASSIETVRGRSCCRLTWRRDTADPS